MNEEREPSALRLALREIPRRTAAALLVVVVLNATMQACIQGRAIARTRRPRAYIQCVEVNGSTIAIPIKVITPPRPVIVFPWEWTRDEWRRTLAQGFRESQASTSRP